MKIRISRLDYKNRKEENRGLVILPSVESFEGLDINEISSITLGSFSGKEEAESLMAKFPKSYKPRVCRVNSISNEEYWSVYFDFNTFWTNNTTGEINESANARRLKVINKIKEII